MSGMNEFLAQYYGTAGDTVAETDMNEDLHKQASIELFAKLAQSQNINLAELSDAQVDALYADFQKQASEDGDKGDKKEEAKKELEEKKAAAEKVAEADYLGRVMAHSYIDELNKIAASKDMSHVPGHGSSRSLPKGERTHVSPGKSVSPENMTAFKARQALEKGKDKVKDVAGKAGKFLGKHKGVAAGVAGGAALAGGAAMLAGKKKEGSASALDELAAESAIVKAAQGGYNVEEAGEKIAAVLTLGIGESEKIAGVADVDTAIDIRSLEMLEAAGYPVTWPQ